MRRKWKQLASGLLIGGGLYVPPFIGRLLPKVPVNRMGWYPCPGCCPDDCSCENCAENRPPCCFKVVISGVVEEVPEDCGNCDCLNDTFLVPFDSACLWQRTFAGIYCNGSPVKVTSFLDGSDYKIKVEVGSNVWIKNYSTTKPNCRSLLDESISFSASADDCDASGSTCLITAIIADNDETCFDSNYDCSFCKCRRWPNNMLVKLDEFRAGVLCPGDICPGLNNTDPGYIFNKSETTSCLYTFTLDPSICGIDYMRLRFTFLNVVGDIYPMITVDLSRLIGSFFNVLVWRKTYPIEDLTINCMELSDENIPWSFHDGSAYHCDKDGVPGWPTCKVTSLN